MDCKKEKVSRFNWVYKTVSIILIILLSASSLGCQAVFQRSYSASGQVVNYEGSGISGVEIYFSDEFGVTETGEDGYWRKDGLSGEITITPRYGQVIFIPIQRELSGAAEDVNFRLLKEMEEGFTSSAGEFIAFSDLSTAEYVEITVVVEDEATGELLEGIEAEVIVADDTIEIILQDSEGNYFPEIIVLDMDSLEDYPGIEIKRGSLYLRITAGLIAVFLDVAGLVIFAAGGIAIATGAGTLPGAGLIVLSFGMDFTSRLLKLYAFQEGEEEVTAKPITVYVFDSHDNDHYTTLKIKAGTSFDEIDEAVRYVVGDRAYDIFIPEENPAGAYYNEDGTPKIFYVYLTEDDSCLDYGSIPWQDGTYSGELKDCIPHGQGTWSRPDGVKYSGEFSEGLRHGQGTSYDSGSPHPEGIRYTGEWKDGLRHGHGTMYYNGGDWYVGAWANDKKHGEGTHYIPTNTPSGMFRKVGEWKNGKEYLVENITGCGTQRWFSGSGY